MSAKQKAFLQHQSNGINNNHPEVEQKQHVYAKHPMDCSVPEDGPPPATYSIPSPVIEKHLETQDSSPIEENPTDEASDSVFTEDSIDESNEAKEAVKVDSTDIMNMDIIFEDAPIPLEANTNEPVVNAGGSGGFSSMTDNTIYIIEPANNNEVITLESSSTLNAMGKEAEQPTPTVASNPEPIVVQEPANDVETTNIIDCQAINDDEPSQISLPAVKPEIPVVDVKTGTIAPKSEAKPSTSEAPVSKPPLRRKKPLPILVGRNSKVQRTETAAAIQPITSATPPTTSSTAIEPKSTLSTITSQKPDPEPIIVTPASTNKSAETAEKHDNKTDQVPEADAEMTETSESDNPADLMDSLVVVESQDPHNPDRIIHEVYVMCPLTKQLSDQPLDLPDEVIQRIRSTMQ